MEALSQVLPAGGNGISLGNEEMLEHPKIKEIMQNPLEAYQKNEALRNLLSKHDPSLSQLFDNKESDITSEEEPSTDLGSIDLESKIKICPLDDKPKIVKVLLLGRSGCGQTSLLGYLTDNTEFKGADTMFAQNFEANSFDIEIGDVGFEIGLTESPGMCGGMELDELGNHWKELIRTINDTGGVGIFMLLIKSNERILLEFFEEFEAFSAKYVEDTTKFWERTIVIFTSIDELKGCDTYEASVKRLQKQIECKGMERLKNIIDKTKDGPLYVSSVRVEQKKQFLQKLSNAISLIIENPLKDVKQKSDDEISHEENNVKTDFSNTSIKNTDLKSNTSEINPKFPKDENEISESNSEGESEPKFLEDLTRDQLLQLIKAMCEDKLCSKVCKDVYKRQLDKSVKSEPTSKRSRSKSFFGSWFHKKT